jgi:hypothetical protein
MGPADSAVDALLRTDPRRPFTVQLLNEHWFVGEPGAAQRIEDGAWLDTWLAANGARGRLDLDFAGDHALKERFLTELTGDTAHPPAPSNVGEDG